MPSTRRHRIAATGGLAIALFVAGCGFDESPMDAALADPVAKAIPPHFTHWAAEPRRFAAGTSVADLVAAPDRLLATTLGPAASKLLSFDESGVSRPFAPHFAPGDDVFCAIELSQGREGFAEAVLVSAGSDLWQLPADGSVALQMTALPAADGEVLDLCFDPTGALGLVALTTEGALYRIDGGGNAARLGDAGPGATGIGIAPAQLTAFAGQILVAFPSDSAVRAMDASGRWTPVTTWPGVRGICTIPDNPRGFGNTGGAAFLATDTGRVHRFALTDVAARAGQIILTTSQNAGSGLVVPQGSGFTTRAFSRFVGAELAIAAVRRPEVQRIEIDIWPGMHSDSQSIVLGADTLVPVVVLSSIGFDPRMLDRGELTLAGASPVPLARGRVGLYLEMNGDGVQDYFVAFRLSEMQLAPGSCSLQLNGVSIGGERVRGTDRMLVLEP